jgi:hypothetical protein
MWQNKLILIFSTLALSGCMTFGFGKHEPVQPIETICKPIERTPLAVADPAPLRLKAPKWLIVTPANADAIWKDLGDKKTDLALFALTDDGYEELSTDIAEIRNLINTQRIIIQKYKEYYERPRDKDTAPAK